MMLLHPAVIPVRPLEYDRLSMTGGIMQRNYTTNEIAIMGHKENVLFSDRGTNAQSLGPCASMESYRVKKICFPLGRHHDH
jgi:hypothetical protein